MKIAILGYGTIGSGVYEIIKNYASKALQDIEVTKILDLPQNKGKLDIITSDINDIVLDDSICCVVETMGGLHPAYEFITSALKNKKHVVTANKAVVAAYLEEFITLANEHGVRFLFEASTGGGIPWIASLNKAKRVDKISQFYGIFNGTGNYILDAMYHQGKDFDEVLKKAQELGYAEADPSADIDGYDVQNKTVISSAIAFNTKIDMKDFPCYGIRNIVKNDIDYFKSKNLNIKYIGEATADDASFEAYVMPNVFCSDAVEANIGSNFNIATLYGESIGPLKFYGQGAGKLPTANAVVQDILDIQDAYTDYELNFSNSYVYNPTQLNTYIIRTKDDIDKKYVAKQDEYQAMNYVHTIPMNANELVKLIDNCEDTSLFVAKVAKFEG
ncbi:homoserine dehydrogenase [Breznakia sp. OttesenSCG-928-G09]|nr:homoserine dehydrogenase [Breznakia sp. OttesenSCG-928-G09]